MNNFEMDRRAKQMADSNTAYNLARRNLMLEEQVKELRREFDGTNTDVGTMPTGKALGYILPSGVNQLKKDHPSTIYAPDNAIVPGSHPIWLYEHPPAPDPSDPQED